MTEFYSIKMKEIKKNDINYRKPGNRNRNKTWKNFSISYHAIMTFQGQWHKNNPGVEILGSKKNLGPVFPRFRGLRPRNLGNTRPRFSGLRPSLSEFFWAIRDWTNRSLRYPVMYNFWELKSSGSYLLSRYNFCCNNTDSLPEPGARTGYRTSAQHSSGC